LGLRGNGSEAIEGQGRGISGALRLATCGYDDGSSTPHPYTADSRYIVPGLGRVSCSIGIIIIIGPFMISELRSGPCNDPLNFLYSAGDHWRDFLTIITVPQIANSVRSGSIYQTIDRQSSVFVLFHDVCFADYVTLGE